MRILNAEHVGYSEEARRILASIGDITDRSLSQAELPRWIPAFEVLIVRLGLRVDRTVIDAAPHLKAIVTATTGLDHVDMGYAAARGITVLSLKGEMEFLQTIHATAEHTWALLLALLRRIPEASLAVRQGAWDRDMFHGEELCGRRLGILGLGRIGGQVARYGVAFHMEVAAYTPAQGPNWPQGVQRCESLEHLLRRSEVLSVHVPLEPSTRTLVGQRELALLPRGAVVINTSRGGVVDEVALVAALRSGHLAGAALDVVEGEFEAGARERSAALAYAREHTNLLITPHLGGATVQSMARTEAFMAERLRQWCEAQGLVRGVGSSA